VLTRYFDSCCDSVIVKYIVSYILHRKTWVKVFENKLKLLLTSVWLIILSQDLFFNISLKIYIADFVSNLDLTSLTLPVC